jgi:hypothetical protein
MMLIVCPVIHSATTAASSEKGADRDDDDERVAPAPQEEQHHEPGQQGSEHRFVDHGAQCRSDVRRLVELVGHQDVVWNERLEPCEVGSDLGDDVERRGVRPLGHRNVDRTAAIDQRIGGGDVRAVGDRSHVAHRHRRARAAADRQLEQVLDRADHGVEGRDARLVADIDAPRRHDHVADRDSADHIVGRQAVRAKPIGIDADDDRALTAAEGRRRRQARQRGESRPDPVERQILDLTEAAPVALEHEVANRHRPGVEAHDERADGAWWHEGARAVDVADRLRESSAMSVPGWKVSFRSELC